MHVTVVANSPLDPQAVLSESGESILISIGGLVQKHGTLRALAQAIFRDLNTYGSFFSDAPNDNDNNLLLPITEYHVSDGVFRINHENVDSLVLKIEPPSDSLVRCFKYIRALN